MLKEQFIRLPTFITFIKKEEKNCAVYANETVLNVFNICEVDNYEKYVALVAHDKYKNNDVIGLPGHMKLSPRLDLSEWWRAFEFLKSKKVSHE